MIKNAILAAALALAPMAASAVTTSGSIAPGDSVDVLIQDYSFQADFNITEAGGSFVFTFNNNELYDVAVTAAFSTILQTANAHFIGGASVAWASNPPGFVVAQGVTAAGSTSTVIAAGGSETLTVTYGDVLVGKLGAQADIDFTVTAEAAPVPLPAGVLLLGTALAGLGFARRRKAA